MTSDETFAREFRFHFFDMFEDMVMKYMKTATAQAMDMAYATAKFDILKGELYSTLPSPALTCQELVDTTCDEPCDWVTMFETPHDCSSCAHLGYEELRVNRHEQDIADACGSFDTTDICGLLSCRKQEGGTDAAEE